MSVAKFEEYTNSISGSYEHPFETMVDEGGLHIFGTIERGCLILGDGMKQFIFNFFFRWVSKGGHVVIMPEKQSY